MSEQELIVALIVFVKQELSEELTPEQYDKIQEHLWDALLDSCE
jgi:hypothetical protein